MNTQVIRGEPETFREAFETFLYVYEGPVLVHTSDTHLYVVDYAVDRDSDKINVMAMVAGELSFSEVLKRLEVSIDIDDHLSLMSGDIKFRGIWLDDESIETLLVNHQKWVREYLGGGEFYVFLHLTNLKWE